MTITTTHNIQGELSDTGYSLVRADEITMLDELATACQQLRATYPDLPRDEYLPDGATYRYRRYDRFRFVPNTGDLTLLPHQDYFQSTDINQVTGGMIRKFAPLTDDIANNPFLHELIRFDFAHFPLADAAMLDNTWQVDVHLIYVVAEAGAEGHPTPEGVHRDGAEFVTVHLAVLDNADGGVVTVYDDDKQPLERFQLQQVGDVYLFNDAILWHGVVPIRSADSVNPAKRGILTFDYHYKPDLV